MLYSPGGAIHIVVYVTGASKVVECSGHIEGPVTCYKQGPCLAEWLEGSIEISNNWWIV